MLTLIKHPIKSFWLNFPILLIKFLNYSICLLILVSLTGCFPWPHTTARSADVQGRVLDAHTHLPVEGAKVFLVQSPHHATYTDANGRFRLQATRQFKLASNEGGGWPDTKSDIVEISHTNYTPHGFAAGMSGGVDVGDILLKPKQ
jgi:hypothetical protein